MEATNSLGPWFVQNAEYGNETTKDLIIISDDFYHIATVQQVYSQNERFYECEAKNAALIAAAPELLGILKDFVSVFMEQPQWQGNELYEYAKQLIDKAEGNHI